MTCPGEQAVDNAFAEVREAVLQERVHVLAREIADEAAKLAIYADYIPMVRTSSGTWWRPLLGIDRESVAFALEYLHLRGLVEHDATGELLRFVEPPPTAKEPT